MNRPGWCSIQSFQFARAGPASGRLDHFEVERAIRVGMDEEAAVPMFDVIAQAVGARLDHLGLRGWVRGRDQPHFGRLVVAGADDDVGVGASPADREEKPSSGSS